MSRHVNLECYEDLGERWYDADDDPVALLRAQSRLLGPWVIAELERAGDGRALDVLEVGCGAGLIANPVAAAGHRVFGADVSAGALEVARRHDATRSVRYERMDAAALDFDDGSFDAVLAMDFLEHVGDPAAIVREAARVLRPGGRLLFNTFSRNPLSYLVIIKGVEWFVPNAPEDLHLYRLFIRPREMREILAGAGLTPGRFLGVRPVLSPASFWQVIRSGVVPREFAFRFQRWIAAGYAGTARKPGR